MVLTDQPLRQVLQKAEATGRLLKWAVELGLVEQRKIVEQYKEFFSLKKNREGLKKFLDTNQDYKEGILERKGSNRNGYWIIKRMD